MLFNNIEYIFIILSYAMVLVRNQTKNYFYKVHDIEYNIIINCLMITSISFVE